MSISDRTVELHPVVRHALDPMCPYLVVVSLPSQKMTEDECRQLLKKFASGVLQAAFRSPACPRTIFNLPIFTAASLRARSGDMRIAIAGGFPQISTASFEMLATRVWDRLVPGMSITLIPSPHRSPERVMSVTGDGVLADIEFTSQSLCAPDARQLPAQAAGATEPDATDVPFFCSQQIPLWANRRAWRSDDCTFGFFTTLGRNGFGDCLLAHYFLIDGEEAIFSTPGGVPALSVEGLGLQDGLAEMTTLKKDVRVRPENRVFLPHLACGEDFLDFLNDIGAVNH